MVLKAQGADKDFVEEADGAPDIFVVSIGDKADIKAQKLVYELRQSGICAERDLCGRSVKAQMKFANKLGAEYSIVLGDDEINENKAALKNMRTGETTDVSLSADEIAAKIKTV